VLRDVAMAAIFGPDTVALRTRVVPKNHVLYGAQIPMGNGNFEGKWGAALR